MKTILIPIIMSLLLISCTGTNHDNNVDKSNLTGEDYRLFQGTPASELAMFVKDENVKGIEQIVKKDPRLINYQEPKYGNTLLKMTIMNQQWKPFKALIDNKADVSIHNTFSGASALIEACSSKHYDIKYAELLLKSGANVNDVETGKRKAGNSTRLTPLMAAVKTGSVELVELLVKNGANINYVNEFKQSALSTAILTAKYNVALSLLEGGADYKAPIFYREEESKDMYLVDVLREAFVDLDTEDHKNKMKIISFLESKGVSYKNAPIPDYIKKKAQENYPNDWKNYLEKY
ncbi:ankyrin repeat domain-containing protein [Mucilaginibacter jinjuensis]|uniref:Ankyrin repeat domain-containing protein n=1 Tax=Mucilaginibacter jinjuensis TaxID=1176721 RepID=A0ABY7TBW3_9SPHI|nr:ankyrin repeat domain-containing protein [Mucilaginibacter jinjuensis]WCT13674.1 ankyrin repeat domain-containing protein [Mucilaginibacter jinjuensis]